VFNDEVPLECFSAIQEVTIVPVMLMPRTGRAGMSLYMYLMLTGSVVIATTMTFAVRRQAIRIRSGR